jgi:cytochrome P450
VHTINIKILKHFNTQLYFQIYYFSGAVYHNPHFFSNPDEFLPERFPDSSGQFVPDERIVYFDSGKRRCVGEVLGRAETYLFSVALVQAFTFTPVEREKQDMGYKPGLNMHIKPFAAHVTPRF